MKRFFLSLVLFFFSCSIVYGNSCRTFPLDSEKNAQLWLFDVASQTYDSWKVYDYDWYRSSCAPYPEDGILCHSDNIYNQIDVCFPNLVSNPPAHQLVIQRRWYNTNRNKTTGQTGLPPSQTDTDGDGIMDDVDENPNEDFYAQYPVGGDFDGDGILNENDFTVDDANWNPSWRDRMSYRNKITGEITGGQIELEDGSSIEWGKERDENLETVYVSIAGEWQDAALFDRGGSAEDEYIFDSKEVEMVDYTGMQVENVENMQTDTSDNIGSTDTEILQDIRQNADSSATGIADISKKITRMTENQTGIAANTQRLIDDVISAIDSKEVGGGGATAGDISSSISSEMEADVEEGTAEIPGNVLGENVGDYVGYDENDIPDVNIEKNEYEISLENFKNNAFSGVNLGISTSEEIGILTCSVWGYTIDADFTKYVSFFDTMGVLWVSLCYLTGFFMIVRK